VLCLMERRLPGRGRAVEPTLEDGYLAVVRDTTAVGADRTGAA
jgi:hypothetical protein